MYHLIGDEKSIYSNDMYKKYVKTEPFDIIKTFYTFNGHHSTEDVKGRYYRLVRKYLKDLVEKNVEVKENE